MSGTAAEAARRRCRKKGKKGNRNGPDTPKQETLFLAEFVLVLTTVPPETLRAETLRARYRCRWQVALVFKHFKRLLQVAELRARAGSVRGHGWLHGKLR